MEVHGFRVRRTGFTLLEALVAVLVLSVAGVGVVAMQLKASQSAHLAYQRSVANMMALDAHERLWVALGDLDGKCPSSSTSPSVANIQSNWLSYWSPSDGGEKLPGVNASVIDSVAGVACVYNINVDWEDERFLLSSGNTEEVSELKYRVKLPGEV